MTRLRVGETLGSQVDWYSKDFGHRLSIVIREIGSKKAAAELIGMNYDQLRKWEAGKTRMPLYAAAILCREAGRSLDWLVYGVGDSPIRPSVPTNTVQVPLFRADKVKDLRLLLEDYRDGARDVQRDEFVRLVAIDYQWLSDSLGLGDLKRVAFLIAEGTAIASAVEAGDVMVVDTAVDRVAEGGLYLVRIGGRLVPVKAQHRIGGKIRLGFDNPNYADEEIEADQISQVEVAGRIRQVWKNY